MQSPQNNPKDQQVPPAFNKSFCFRPDSDVLPLYHGAHFTDGKTEVGEAKGALAQVLEQITGRIWI